MPRSLVALGANLGNRTHSIAQAIAMLRGLEGVTHVAASRLHETSPVGGPPGAERFLHPAVAFDTTLSPPVLHGALARIESQLGRVRGERWSARIIDLDLLLYDELTIDT